MIISIPKRNHHPIKVVGESIENPGMDETDF